MTAARGSLQPLLLRVKEQFVLRHAPLLVAGKGEQAPLSLSGITTIEVGEQTKIELQPI